MTKSTVKSYIRASKHSLKFANPGKLQQYKSFVSEMRKTAQIYVDFLWNHSYQWNDKNGSSHHMCIDCLQLDIPPFFDYNLIPLSSDNKLSARSKSSLVTQLKEYDLEIEEKFQGDPWIASAKSRSNKFLSREDINRLVSDYQSDPDGKGVPYYFVVTSGSGDEYIIYSDDGKFIPINSEKEKNEAKEIGIKKGLVRNQLDF